MSEVVSADTWIYATLAADATLAGVVSGVYSEIALADVTYPLVLFAEHRAESDLMTHGAYRVWSTMYYVVRGIDEANTFTGDLATIEGRIDAVLHAGSGTTAAGTVWECVRTMPFRMVEQRDGRVFRHLGGIYRVRAI